jgi:hypothetical protein
MDTGFHLQDMLGVRYLGVEREAMLVNAGLAQDQWQELVEGDVLDHGRYNVASLLVQPWQLVKAANRPDAF